MQHADTLMYTDCKQTIQTNVQITPLPLPPPTLECFANVLRHCELHLGNDRWCDPVHMQAANDRERMSWYDM